MSDDRIYTVYPYRSGKPPTTSKKGKFWMILAVIICYVVLVAIIVLVVLLTPKNSSITDPAIGQYNKTTEKTTFPLSTRPPFRPSLPDPIIHPYHIDPRSTIGSKDQIQYYESESHDRRQNPGKYPFGWEITKKKATFKFSTEK